MFGRPKEPQNDAERILASPLSSDQMQDVGYKMISEKPIENVLYEQSQANAINNRLGSTTNPNSLDQYLFEVLHPIQKVHVKTDRHEKYHATVTKKFGVIVGTKEKTVIVEKRETKIRTPITLFSLF